MEEHISS